ncbi:TPA: 50S ribosomal protein L2 [Candidatus Micrarchaeota archaeon]|nr:50S ribosomal protein L2 [Candidatus Micrarchaeota archaeon]
MGTRLIQQRRGKGSPAFKSPGHRFFGNIHYKLPSETMGGKVLRFIHDPARDVLVAELLFPNGWKFHTLAAEGIAVGDILQVGTDAPALRGCVTRLGDVADGTPVFNVESHPGDGGKFSRASGTSAFKIGEDEDTGRVNLQLSSKKVLSLSPNCIATVGIASGGGRLEKPFMKAGTKYHKMHAMNRYWPDVRGRAMSAYDHPYGGRTGGKPTSVSHGAPPGRKAGHIGARRTGRNKGKSARASNSASAQGKS